MPIRQWSQVQIEALTGPGQSLYLNLTPLAYGHFPLRSSDTGRAWREAVGAALGDMGLRPRVEVYGMNGREPWMESLLWRGGSRYCLAILKNPSLWVESSHLAAVLGNNIDRNPQEITIRLNLPARNLRNVRTGRVFGNVGAAKDEFKPWEAN